MLVSFEICTKKIVEDQTSLPALVPRAIRSLVRQLQTTPYGNIGSSVPTQLTTPHAPPPLCGNVTNVNLDAEWISSQLTLHTVEVLSLQTAPVKNAKLFFNPWKSASSMRSGVKGRTWQTERVVFAVRSVEDLVVGWHTNKSAKQPTVSK
jgi:hypothetical protein